MPSPIDEQIADLFPEPTAIGLPTIVVWSAYFKDEGHGPWCDEHMAMKWSDYNRGSWYLPSGLPHGSAIDDAGMCWTDVLDHISKSGDDPARALDSLRLVTATAFLRAPAENIPIEFTRSLR